MYKVPRGPSRIIRTRRGAAIFTSFSPSNWLFLGQQCHSVVPLEVVYLWESRISRRFESKVGKFGSESRGDEEDGGRCYEVSKTKQFPTLRFSLSFPCWFTLHVAVTMLSISSRMYIIGLKSAYQKRIKVVKLYFCMRSSCGVRNADCQHFLYLTQQQ